MSVDDPAADRVLTRRQERVLIAFADGLVGKQVAKLLGISESSVWRDMGEVTRKLGAQTGSQAVAVAHAIGLLPAIADLFRDVPQERANRDAVPATSRPPQPTQGDKS